MSDTKPGMGLIKKVALIAGALVVVMAGLAIAVPFMIDWEKVRVAAQEQGSRLLGRNVKIEKLKVGLFSGVEISGFSVGGLRDRAYTYRPLVKADRVVARYSLWRLLLLQVVVNKVELVKPEIFIEVSRKGVFNFHDLVKPGGRKSDDKDGKSKPLSLPIGVNVKSVKVTDGTLSYWDWSQKPVLKAAVQKLNVGLKDFTVSGSRASLRTTLEAVLNKAVVPVSVEMKFGLNLNRSTLSIHELVVTLPGIKSVTSGEVTEFQTIPRLAVRESAEVDIAKAWGVARQFLSPAVAADLAPAGNVKFDAEVGGNPKKLAVKGTVVLKLVTVAYKGAAGTLDGLEGKIEFDQDSVRTTALRFVALQSPFTVDLNIANLGLANPSGFSLATFAPKGTFGISSPKVVLDKVLALAEGDKKKEETKKPAKGGKEPPAVEPCFAKLIPKKADLRGEIRLDEIALKKLKLNAQVVKVVLAGGSLAFTVKGGLYEGKEEVSGAVFLMKCPMEFTLDASMEGFSARPFIDDAADSFLPKAASAVRGKLSGKADAKAALSGKGVTFPNIEKNLKGTLYFKATDGKLAKLDFFEKGVGKQLKLQALSKDLEFKSLGGNFKVEKGWAETKDLTLDPGPEGEMGFLYNGWVSMQTKLKGALTTRFHPRNADDVMKGDVGKLLFSKDKEGWAVGMWDVSGTLTLPIITPSKKQAGKVLQKKATEELKKQAPAAKKLLKGLFKK